jgi:NADH-quinone oxidoreductase subunit J
MSSPLESPVLGGVLGPVLAQASDAGGTVSTGEAVAFWILGVTALAGGLGMVFARNAVHSALWLALTMLCLGALYMVQQAPFLGFVQIIVYTGAVMMLFLFVLMLVGRDSSDSVVEVLRGQRLAAAIAGIALAVLLVGSLAGALAAVTPVGLGAANTAPGGNVGGIGRLVFTQYLFPFELTSALLITAALGAMVLAHRERVRPKATQRELARARFIGPQPSPLPGPGTYALHNAIDMPALLPDGTVSPKSINRVLARHDTEDGVRPTDPEKAALIKQVIEKDIVVKEAPEQEDDR